MCRRPQQLLLLSLVLVNVFAAYLVIRSGGHVAFVAGADLACVVLLAMSIHYGRSPGLVVGDRAAIDTRLVDDEGEFYRLVTREMERSRRFQRPLAVLLVDAEPLRSADVGALAAVKVAIERSCRLLDEVLYEEAASRFVVLCPEAGAAVEGGLEERIRGAVFDATGHTPSTGIAGFPRDGIIFADLVAVAGERLEASRTGREATPSRGADLATATSSRATKLDAPMREEAGS